jgi:hypothetical protein
VIFRQDIKDILNNHIELATKLLLITLGAYIFILAGDNSLWKVPIFFVGLLSWLLLQNRTKYPIILIMCFFLLTVDLYHSYFWLANHHFLLTFMVLSVLIYSYHKKNDILMENIQILLGYSRNDLNTTKTDV